MSPRRNRFRPRLESLESRDTPSNFTVGFSGLTHTLTVTGDSAGNNLQVDGVAGDATKFLLSSTSDTFNNSPGPFTSPSGVQNITIQLLGGDDAVNFNNTVPIDLKGSLSINGGDGANSVSATDLKVGKNLSITNATNPVRHGGIADQNILANLTVGGSVTINNGPGNTLNSINTLTNLTVGGSLTINSKAGTDTNTLVNLTVGGSLTINNGLGDTSTHINGNSAGTSAVQGSITITNGSGEDDLQITDMNVGGNLSVNDGHGNASGIAGYTEIFNTSNTSFRSTIKGNVTVSYLDGNTTFFNDGIWDTEVGGNVTFNHGSGSATTSFDGFKTSLPVIIRGNLTLTGSGANTVTAGTEYNHTGLVIGKNLTITTGSGSDTLTFFRLEVDGVTKLTLGDGDSGVTIDDSTFAGKFTLTTGSGNDSVSLDHTAGTSAPTLFEQPVLLSLGAGDDTVTRAGGDDANQELIVLSTFVIHHGAGNDTDTVGPAGQEVFPFGTSILWVV
jgi:hypothetical protein